jgi:predicted lipoprotein with Yx(FWY)xxD motif
MVRCAGQLVRRLPSSLVGAIGRPVRVAAALMAGAALALASCGATTGPPRFVHGPTDMVQATQVGGLGRILVDGDGMTLYMFTPDRHSGHSTCYSFCAAEWPPLVLPAGASTPPAGPGVARSLLGTTRRANGQLQVTYDGWPLYTWFGDDHPGDATGQALANAGGLWYVLRPDGSPET